MDSLAGKTISATDFIEGLRSYRDEVGVPATTRPVVQPSALAGKSGTGTSSLNKPLTEERKPRVQSSTLPPPSLPAKREGKEVKKPKIEQGSLW